MSATEDFLRTVDKGLALAGTMPFSSSRHRTYAQRVDTLVRAMRKSGTVGPAEGPSESAPGGLFGRGPTGPG